MEQKVPWHARIYTFQWTDGGVTLLPLQWTIESDAKGKVTGYASTRMPEGNANGFPELSYDQAKKMEQISSKEGVSLKLAFARVVDIGALSEDARNKIAAAPEMYALPSQEAHIVSQKKAVVDKFWADVNAQKSAAAAAIEAELDAIPKG